jgi:predicted RNA binding protein YcfA (HicA-like mRNA interferase family)
VPSLEKLKRQLRSSPKGIRFADLVRVLRDLGFEEARSKGSHHIFRRPGGPGILIVKPHGGRNFCSLADVHKVVELLEQGEEN